ncbi:MAG TPA: phospholipase D-like domain-containing protein [Vicinamibacterales bacterium]|nr:phospholipase D-like domain-containing protein [Vicinamibacterales bacterium]
MAIISQLTPDACGSARKLLKPDRMRLPRLRKVALGVLITAAVVASLLLLAQDQVTLKLRSETGAGDPHHAEYVAGLLGAQLTHGNRFAVLTNGDQIFPAMLEAIQQAKRRISFETYIYESGEVAGAFTRALAEAAGRGVRVNLVVDAVGGSGINSDDVKQLEDAGCRVVRFNTLRWYSLEEANYRTHRKVLVVDGDVAFTGGVGIADHWKGNAQDEDHWRDTMVQVTGPAARLLEGGFYENFTEAVAEAMPELDGVGPVRGDQGAAFVVRSSPSGGANDMKRLYLLGLAAARRSVDITTPYFMPDESSRWSLQDAAKRGVQIRLLVEGDKTDAKPVKYASRRYYEELLKLGVEIYEYQPTMMHAKTFVVDGTWNIVGSANFDNRSLELNDELNVAVSSPELAARLLEDFDRDRQHARRITLEEWRQRSLWSRLLEQFWALFGEIF